MAVIDAVGLVDVQLADALWLSSSGRAWAKSERWEALTHRPVPEEVQRLLWESVSLQKVLSARSSEGSRPVGITQLTRMDLSIGVAHLDMMFDPAAHAEVRGAVDRFLALARERFPLRKVYIEVAADTIDAGHLPSAVRRCGVLADHRPRGSGRYVDVFLYELGGEKEGDCG